MGNENSVPHPVQIPIFPTSSLDNTVAFYTLLGFAETRRYDGKYLILKHGERKLEIHFSLAGDHAPPVELNYHSAYVRFNSDTPVIALNDAWRAVSETEPFTHLACSITRVTDMEQTDYGLHEFGLVDNCGNLIRFGGPSGC